MGIVRLLWRGSRTAGSRITPRMPSCPLVGPGWLVFVLSVSAVRRTEVAGGGPTALQQWKGAARATPSHGLSPDAAAKVSPGSQTGVLVAYFVEMHFELTFLCVPYEFISQSRLFSFTIISQSRLFRLF